MGRATALLRTRRAAVFAAVATTLAVYYAFHESLPDVGTWTDVAFLGLVLMPLVFALVWLVLPLWRAQGLLAVALAFAVLAVLLHMADLAVVANFAKLAAMTGLAFWFLTFFESVLWVALVACIIPVVDSFSVWRGPTRHIVTEQREVFTALSFAFRIPGERPTANLGLPDLLFFALFLGAAGRFGLRVGWTWAAMVASFGLTIVLAVALDVVGLPALPLLSLAFLIVNADLIWRQLRARPRDANAGA